MYQKMFYFLFTEKISDVSCFSLLSSAMSNVLLLRNKNKEIPLKMRIHDGNITESKDTRYSESHNNEQNRESNCKMRKNEFE